MNSQVSEEDNFPFGLIDGSQDMQVPSENE